jgi:hypothetical protein
MIVIGVVCLLTVTLTGLAMAATIVTIHPH